MTSVPSLQPLSSGSKWLMIMMVLLYISCGTTQPVSTSQPKTSDPTTVKVYNPETGEYEDVPIVAQTTMDTIGFEQVDEVEFVPISDYTPAPIPKGGYEEIKKSVYKVAMMLPFVSGSAPSPGMRVNTKSLIAIQFYGGVKLALEDLENQGIQIDLTVMDTDASASKVSSLLNRSEALNTDLIIGPYRNSSVQRAASFAKENRIPVVSPFIAHDRLTSENPFFIQVNPSLRRHAHAILGHIKSQYDSDQITLVAIDNSNERSRLQMFQEVHREQEGGDEIDDLDKLVITRTMATEEVLPIDTTLFHEGRKAVYVFPSWSSERLIYDFLRKINLAKGADNQLVVYGMPQWMKYDYYDYFERLNVHVPTATFANESDRRVGKFRSLYKSRYGELPDGNAFLGYDVMMYFGKQLASKGTQFYKLLDQNEERMLSTIFNFERVRSSTDVDDSELEVFDYYENQYLNMIQFKEYKFQIAN